MEFTTLLAVAIGGGTGAVLRYLIANVGQSFTAGTFPLGTLSVNIIGCALIGLITAIVIDPFEQHREILRLFLIVGILGGFTTFSSFALDAIELVDDGKSGQAALYIILSNVLGLFAAFGCYRIGSFFISTTPA